MSYTRSKNTLFERMDLKAGYNRGFLNFPIH